MGQSLSSNLANIVGINDLIQEEKDETSSEEIPEVMISFENSDEYCVVYLDRLATNLQLGQDIQKYYGSLEEFEACTHNPQCFDRYIQYCLKRMYFKFMF